MVKTVTFFGAESTGKTTLSKRLARSWEARWIHEWARPYLERFGPEVTAENMKIIESAQYAAQSSVRRIADTALIVQDTDLLSTIGYYRIYSKDGETESVRRLFEATKSDLYIVMNSLIPFEADPLRYGGSTRESTDQFWIDLLEEFGCNYHVIESDDRLKQFWEADDQIFEQLFNSDPVKTFIRD